MLDNGNCTYLILPALSQQRHIFLFVCHYIRTRIASRRSLCERFHAIDLLLAVFGLGFDPGGLGPGCAENLKPTQFYMLNNYCSTTLP